MSDIAMILAGGEGSRLQPLTKHRAKPAVMFGGNYRIIDFVLSNFINSGILKIYVVTQYRPFSLMEHLNKAWNFMSVLGNFMYPLPPGMHNFNRWYEGTADAVMQNISLLKRENPEHVCIFGGDHVYKMDVKQMIRFHDEKKADLSIATVPVKVEEASELGIIKIDETGRVIGFQEKPKENPCTVPGKDDTCLASMGNYVFSPRSAVQVPRRGR